MVLAPHLLETDWQHQYSSTNQELFSLKIVLLKKTMPMFYEFNLAHLLCRLKVGKLRILVNQ
jgi:hypothetical protein